MACGTSRHQPEPGPRRKGKKTINWQKADHLLSTQFEPRPAPPAPPPKPVQPARAHGRGEYVQVSCRLVFGPGCLDDVGAISGASVAGRCRNVWRRVWRVDVPCSVLPTCPICLEVPQLPRALECGHLLCLPCALRHLHATRPSYCPICAVGPISLEDFRPAVLEVVEPPELGDERWSFQLVRRTGAHRITLASISPTDQEEFTREGEEGWQFARRVIGDSGERIASLCADKQALQALSSCPEEALPAAALQPGIEQLNSQLREAHESLELPDSVHKQPSGHQTWQHHGTEDVGSMLFYQSSNSQLVFLEPGLTKRMLAVYGTWEALPHRIHLRALQIARAEMVTDELHYRHRFLAHLAGGEIHFVAGKVEPEDGSKQQTVEDRPPHSDAPQSPLSTTAPADKAGYPAAAVEVATAHAPLQEQGAADAVAPAVAFIAASGCKGAEVEIGEAPRKTGIDASKCAAAQLTDESPQNSHAGARVCDAWSDDDS